MYFVYTYMTATPEGISFNDLQNLLADAPKEEDQKQADPTDQEFIEKIADEALVAASEKCSGPMVHKVMILMILSNMIEWHTKVGMNMLKDGEEESARSWLRDAGKCQAMADILYSVQIGADDWCVNE